MRNRCLIAGLLLAPALIAQPATSEPAFEVETVRPSKSEAPHSAMNMTPAGNVSLRNVTVLDLLTAAYHKRANAIVDMPGWFRSAQFDIVAKGPPQMTEADVSMRLRLLLAAEFKLVAHEEARKVRAFAIVTAKGGPTLRESSLPSTPGCKRGGNGANRVGIDCESITLDDLIGPITFLAQDYLDRPVVNLTDLTGPYRVSLEWAAQKVADADGGPTIFSAFEKLGLKLDLRETPVPVLVIDGAERPSGN